MLTEPQAARGTQAAPSSVQPWNSILGLLEAAVSAAEKSLTDPLGPLTATGRTAGATHWTPPETPGQLPDELRDRALALAGAQQRIAARLEAAKLAAAKQLAAVESVAAGAPARGAVYLDVQG
jgi:hypothetical protein